MREQDTNQLQAWTADFGQIYTDRNTKSAQQMDEELGDYYAGVKKTEIFRQFLPPQRIASGRVLEVGANIGLQLEMLRMVNPGLDFYGVEPMEYALSRARERNPDMTFVTATAYDIPFKDGYFDVVMTNNVLIHVSPQDLPRALAEIHRCSGRFIFVHEYFAEETVEINYRGHTGLLWKTDFRQRYLDQFPELRVVDLRYLPYPDPDGGQELVDQVCLFEKAPD